MSHDKELAAVDAVLQHDDQALDKLVNDSSEDVRVFVAKAGRSQDLNQLIDDPSPYVRMAVARYGRPEDRQKLLGDPSPMVRSEARRGLLRRSQQ